jgi:poly(3-hydroxybutyrate) depolymerase
MKKTITLFSLFLLSSASLMAQEPCSTGRYSSDVYTNITTTSNITYGQNTGFSGSNTTLKLDFYEPASDTAALRPLIIWAHGGSFLGGTKTDVDVVDLSNAFAKKGYVCASIDYRTGFFPIDSVNAVKAVVRAVQDMKASIRFFYADRQGANLYKIDTTRIYIGGSSAGAITALHVAYLDDECKISDYLNAGAISSLGGLDGLSGNPGYSTNVHGVINLCGALARYSWLEGNDVPLCSLHGTADGTVKYNRGIVNPGIPLMYLDGSRMLHERACAVGVENQFYTFNGAPHVPYAGTSATTIAYMDTTVNFVRDFLIKQLGCTNAALQPENARAQSAVLYPVNDCQGNPIVDVCLSSGINSISKDDQISIYPNPSASSVNISWSEKKEMIISLIDFAGRTISNTNVSGSSYVLERNGLTNGVYLLIISDNEGNKITRRVVLN